MHSAHIQNGTPILQVLPCETDAELAPTAIELSIQYDDLFKVLVASGWCNESDGSVEAPTGYFSYISYEEKDKAAFADLLSHQDYAQHLEARFMELEFGWYLTREDSNGLIWVWYDTEANIKAAYKYLVKEFSEWDDVSGADGASGFYGEDDGADMGDE